MGSGAHASWATAAPLWVSLASFWRSRPLPGGVGTSHTRGTPGEQTHPSPRARAGWRWGRVPCSPLRSLLPSPALLRALLEQPIAGRRAPGGRARRPRGLGSLTRDPARNAHAAQIPSTPSGWLLRCRAQARSGALGGGAHLEREASRSWGEGAREGTAGTQKRTETRKEPGRAKVEKAVKAERKVASEAGIKMQSLGRGGEGLGRAHVCHP